MEVERALKNIHILNELSPQDPLYVARPDDSMLRIARLLKGKSRQQKVLLAGQHGCGKTTELLRLSDMLKNDYFVVVSGVRELRELGDPVDIEFLFVLLRALTNPIRSLDSSNNITFDRVFSRLKQIGIRDFEAKFSIMGIELSTSRQSKHRDITMARESAIRNELHAFRSELLDTVNSVIKHLEELRQLPLLIIIDDMEKLDYAQVRKLFHDYSGLLSRMPCAVVYTVPPWLLFESDLSQRLNEEFHSFDMANVPIASPERRIQRNGFDFLISVVRSRIGRSWLWEGNARRILAMASGGHLRQCLKLFSSSLLFSLENSERKVSIDDARRAIQDGERDFARILTFDEREMLKTVARTKDYNVGLPAALFNNLSVLEYWSRKWSTWYDINPLTYPKAGEPSVAESLRPSPSQDA